LQNDAGAKGTRFLRQKQKRVHFIEKFNIFIRLPKQKFEDLAEHFGWYFGLWVFLKEEILQ
jgi:hypothetical protein